MSKFLRPHGLEHTRPPCPLLSPGVCSHSLGDGRIPSLTQWTWVWANFSYGSGGKESACNAVDSRDPGLIPGSGRSLEKEMATHSSILAREVQWTEEPGGLQSMGLQRVGHDWVTNTLEDKDREARYAEVHGVTKCWTQLSDWTTTWMMSIQVVMPPEYLIICRPFSA